MQMYRSVMGLLGDKPISIVDLGDNINENER